MTIYLTSSAHVGKLKIYLFVVISSSQNFFNKRKKVQCKKNHIIYDGMLIALDQLERPVTHSEPTISLIKRVGVDEGGECMATIPSKTK